MKVAFVTPSLQPGGAERVLSTMANYWATHHQQVAILTIDSSARSPFFRLDNAVRIRSLDMSGESPNVAVAMWKNGRRLLALRKALRDEAADVVVSFLTETNVLTLLAAAGLSIPVVVAEHTDPYKCPVSPPWGALRRTTYARAHRIIVLTPEARSFFSPALQRKVEIIPNPVLSGDDGYADGRLPEREEFILAVGRLSAEKGFDLLLRAFSIVAPEMNSWRLVIVGDGPDRPKLEQLANKLEIAEKVSFHGVVQEPRPYFQRAGAFVLSSRYEGFPMGLCEAMSFGCPVVATEYNSTVHDLINSGKNGLVVPAESVDELAAALRKLLRDEMLRETLGTAARNITDKYGVAHVMKMWEGCIPALDAGETSVACG